MDTIDQTAGMDPDLKSQMQEACDRIAKGVLPTIEQRKAARERINRRREANARIFGIQDVTLAAVREARNNQ